MYDSSMTRKHPPTNPVEHDATYISETFLCPSCKYDLRGLYVGMSCPECGWEITRTGKLRTRTATDIGDAPLSYILASSAAFFAFGVSGLLMLLQPILLLLFGDRIPAEFWLAALLLSVVMYAMSAVVLTTHKRLPESAIEDEDSSEAWRTRFTARIGAAVLPVSAVLGILSIYTGSVVLGAMSAVAFVIALVGLVPLTAWLADLADWAPSAHIARQYRGCSFIIGTSLSLMVLAALFSDPTGLLRSFEATTIFFFSSGIILTIATIVLAISTFWVFILSLRMVNELGWARLNARQRNAREQRIEARHAKHFQDHIKPPSYEEFSAPDPVEFSGADQEIRAVDSGKSDLMLPGETPCSTSDSHASQTTPDPSNDVIPLSDAPVDGAPTQPLNLSERVTQGDPMPTKEPGNGKDRPDLPNS